MWSEHFDIIQAGFPVPGEFEHLPFSLTYGEDVARAVVGVINKRFELSYFWEAVANRSQTARSEHSLLINK